MHGACMCDQIIVIFAVHFHFTDYRSLWNMRNYIHCMLCGSMFSALLVYSAGVYQTENEVKMMKTVVFLLSSPALRFSVQPLLWCFSTCSW